MLGVDEDEVMTGRFGDPNHVAGRASRTIMPSATSPASMRAFNRIDELGEIRGGHSRPPSITDLVGSGALVLDRAGG